jgi:hypothetical protein
MLKRTAAIRSSGLVGSVRAVPMTEGLDLGAGPEPLMDLISPVQ